MKKNICLPIYSLVMKKSYLTEGPTARSKGKKEDMNINKPIFFTPASDGDISTTVRVWSHMPLIPALEKMRPGGPQSRIVDQSLLHSEF